VLSPKIVDASQSLTHCREDTQDRACPHGGWETINQNHHSYWPNLQPLGNMPETIAVPSRFSARRMLLRHRSTGDVAHDGILTSTIWQSAFTTASAPHAVLADGLAEVRRLWAFAAANGDKGQRFHLRKDVTYETIAPQPISQARCVKYLLDGNTVGSLRFPIPVSATWMAGLQATRQILPRIWSTMTPLSLVKSTAPYCGINRQP
jgi:hypothetical protein